MAKGTKAQKAPTPMTIRPGQPIQSRVAQVSPQPMQKPQSAMGNVPVPSAGHPGITPMAALEMLKMQRGM